MVWPTWKRSSTRRAPCLAEVKWTSGKAEKRRAVAGAVAAPDRIPLSAPCPADFDAFWQAELKELKAVPANPRLESVDIGNTNLEYWKITMDNIRGTHIQGQIACPARGKKFPALLDRAMGWRLSLATELGHGRAEEGWLALNIEAHDLPIDAPESFYKDQFAGPLHNYWSIGNDDRDTSYYLRMYLSCFRAAEYLIQRKDWDGKTLVVTGTSQGGMQTLMLAGLHPRKLPLPWRLSLQGVICSAPMSAVLRVSRNGTTSLGAARIPKKFMKPAAITTPPISPRASNVRCWLESDCRTKPVHPRVLCRIQRNLIVQGSGHPAQIWPSG